MWHERDVASQNHVKGRSDILAPSLGQTPYSSEIFVLTYDWALVSKLTQSVPTVQVPKLTQDIAHISMCVSGSDKTLHSFYHATEHKVSLKYELLMVTIIHHVDR